jgi:hypothetical protein
MKQKDLGIIIAVAILSAIVSFLLSNKLFVTPENRQQKVEVVDAIVSEFDQPSTKFNICLGWYKMGYVN